MKTTEELRLEIAELVQEFADLKYTEKTFKPGRSVVPPSGKVIGATELQYMVDASLDGWLTTGRFNRKFEKKLSKFIGVKHLITVNSGSSANLVAFSTLTSPKLGDRAIKKGDEVIVPNMSFIATANVVSQVGAKVVFCDISNDLNIDISKIKKLITPKTKAIIPVPAAPYSLMIFPL